MDRASQRRLRLAVPGCWRRRAGRKPESRPERGHHRSRQRSTVSGSRGPHIAAVAMARKLAVIIWHLLTRGENYAWARPALHAKKLRELELRSGRRRDMIFDKAGDTDTLLKQANEWAAEGRYLDAKKVLHDIITGHADKAAAYALMIEIEQDLNNIQEAISLSQEALQRFPANDNILLGLGWLYFTAGAESRAADCAATLIASPVLSLSLAARRLLIFIRAGSREWKSASAHLKIIQDQNPALCSIIAREVAPTFQGILVKTLADGNIPIAYKLLEDLPKQVAPELTRIIEHMALRPSMLPKHRAPFSLGRLTRRLHNSVQKAGLASSFKKPSQLGKLPDADRYPKISVITPVLNGGKTIRSTIKSVLQQEGADLEYIIIDGGSTDETLSIIAEYSDRINLVLSEKDKGLYDAVGKGLDLATGDILCYLDASDTFEKGALARVISAFLANPGHEVIYFDETLDYGVWKTQNKRQPEVEFLTLWRGHILFQPSVFFSKRAYLFVGGVNRSLKLAGDSELWLRLSYRFRFKYCRGHVSTSSVHDGQLSQDMVAYYGELLKIRQSLSEVLTSVDWLRAQVREAVKRGMRQLSLLSANERKYRRLLFPLTSMEFNSPTTLATLPDKDICPVWQTPPSMFIASILCADRGNLRVNRAIFHDRSGLISVYPKFLLDSIVEDHLTQSGDDAQMRRAHDAEAYRNAHLLMRPKRRSFIALRTLLLSKFKSRIGTADHSKHNDSHPTGQQSRFSPHPVLRKTFSQGKLLICGRRDDGFVAKSMTGVANSNKFKMDLTESVPSHGALSDQIVISSFGERISAPATTRAFQTVVVQNAQVLMNDPIVNLQKISILLAPGGHIVTVLPNADSFMFDLFGLNWKHLYTAGPSLIYSKKSLRLIAEKSGLKVERMFTVTTADMVAAQLSIDNEIGAARGTLVTRICLAARYVFDWRSRGDEFVVVMSRK